MSNNTDTLRRGDRIGCYRIEEVLGRGGFAVTYLATDENLDVEVAIKEYLPREITQRDNNLQVSARKPEFSEDYDTGLANFAREAKTLARFKHPHIVRVHQVLHANNTAYMVMDYEHGQELGDILEQHQTLSEQELRDILFPIMDGVEEIHRHGFVHRDIKPSNIYVRHNGSPVLIDFGAARYTLSETTQQLTAVVTVGYTPIEQYNVSEDAQGPWSDIYALAAVCYEAVTGEVPTDSVTRASATVTHGDDPLPSVRSKINGVYSDDCLDAIDWGLRMEADDRPQVIAQWRDSFDGIFNPASAYVEQTDASIYSPHRVDKPLGSRTASSRPTAETHDTRPTQAHDHNDVVSIPLQTNDTVLDRGVVSLRRDSAVTEMPPVPGSRDSRHTSNATPNVSAHPTTRRQVSQSGTRTTPAESEGKQMPTTNAANQSTATDHPDAMHSQQAPKKRSKFERPSHLSEAPAKRRVISEEIEFDDSDWGYAPPKGGSPFKLLLPFIGLAAVVGGSVLVVNFPEVLPKFGSSEQSLTVGQAIGLADVKLDTGNYIFPQGDSALDYYQIALQTDPDNLEAQAGIRLIENTIREQIAENMAQNDLTEANRILARADDAGLRGIYNTPGTTSASTSDSASANTNNTASNATIAESSPVVASADTTVITPVNTASLEPASTNTQIQPTGVAASVTPDSTTSNTTLTIPPSIQRRIAEINSLIDENRLGEARLLLSDTDRFISDPAVSRDLQQRIENSEAQVSSQQATVENQVTSTFQTVASSGADSTDNAPITTTDSVQTAAPQNTAPQNAAVNDTTASTPVVTPSAPPRRSFIDASGPAAAHLNQLRLALEARDIEAVQALSQPLPEGRIQFLNSTFARHPRLDVIIDNVTTSGDTVSGRLNMAMFGQAEDGSVYSAGKWNGAIIEATLVNGEWQKIRW